MHVKPRCSPCRRRTRSTVRRTELVALGADPVGGAEAADRIRNARLARRVGRAREAAAGRELVELALSVQGAVAIARDLS